VREITGYRHFGRPPYYLQLAKHQASGDRQQKKFNSLNTEVKESRCKYCGSFVARRNGAKKKIFCSDRCRM